MSKQTVDVVPTKKAVHVEIVAFTESHPVAFQAMLTLLFSLGDCSRALAVLQAEILALRHQILVLHRSSRGHKLRLRWADRVLWLWLSRLWGDWRSALLLVKPETVIAWHRRAFRAFWRWKSHRRLADRRCLVMSER